MGLIGCTKFYENIPTFFWIVVEERNGEVCCLQGDALKEITAVSAHFAGLNIHQFPTKTSRA